MSSELALATLVDAATEWAAEYISAEPAAAAAVFEAADMLMPE